MADIRKLVWSCKLFCVLLYLTFFIEITNRSNLMVHARFVPVSKSFRFPSSLEESSFVGDLLFPTSSLSENINKQREHANVNTEELELKLSKVLLAMQPKLNPKPRSSFPSSSRNSGGGSIPESASPDEVINKDLISSYSEEETISSEVIHADSTSGEGEPEVDPSSPPKGKKNEDEELRNALCSSFNSPDDGKTSSSPPKVRYDLHAGKCGEVGTKAHCGRNMIFVAEIDSGSYGFCECDYENKIRKREEKQIGRATPTPFVFHLETNACYPLYEQSYCKDGEWLVLSQKEKKAVCEKRRCSSSSSSENKIIMKSAGVPRSSRRRSKLITPELWVESSPITSSKSSSDSDSENATAVWVPLNGNGPCVQLNKESAEYCEVGEQVLFNVGNTVPKCGIPGREIEGRAIIRNACPPGSFYSIIGRCQPDWDF